MKYELKSEQFEVTITDANGKELVHACGSIHLRTNIAALIASVTALLTGEPQPEASQPEPTKPEEPKSEAPKQEEPRMTLHSILREAEANAAARHKFDASIPQAVRIGDSLVFHNGKLPPHVIDDILRTIGIGDAKQE